MYQPTYKDYVVIDNERDEFYLRIGKIVKIIYNELHTEMIDYYIISFYDSNLKSVVNKQYEANIFYLGKAKVLNFKE